MKNQSTQSLWVQTDGTPRYPRLLEDMHCDVCVVGGGIAGLTTAYLLAGTARSVVVLEADDLGRGETGRTSAHLTVSLDNGYDDIESMHGAEAAKLVAGSHSAAIDKIEAIVAQEDIACGFERIEGYLFLAPGDDPKVLDPQMEAARRAGLDVTRLSSAPGANFDTGPCLHFPRQAQFHPLRYLDGLAQALERRGGQIFTGTRVQDVAGTTPVQVKTADGRLIVAKSVVVATNTPVIDRYVIHAKQAPYRTYAIGIKIAGGSVPRALYWDTAMPYHYVRTQDDVLIVGGEDHKTGQEDNTAKAFDRLLAWARARFNGLGEMSYCWSGQCLYPVDGLAYIGRNPGEDANIFIVTGDAGTGLTYGTIAGMLLTDLIGGVENPWAKIYDPSRITLKAAKEFGKENLNVAAQYADLVTGGDVDGESGIARGSGAILRDGLTKIAAYRDGAGHLHKKSALCPHLGCVVAWNDTEKSWDCPCHGSRFDALGEKVLNGPAISGLSDI